MRPWYKLSLACGFVPLCTGILIFLGWLITRVHWLKMAGAVTLSAGAGLFVIGVLYFLVYFIQSRNNAVTLLHQPIHLERVVEWTSVRYDSKKELFRRKLRTEVRSTLTINPEL